MLVLINPIITIAGKKDVNVTIPIYYSTMLTLEPEEISVDIGEEIVIEATLTADIDGESKPLEGKSVKFILESEYTEYMDTDMGVAVTDKNGKATLIYQPVYSGQYTVKAMFDINDDEHYLGAQATVQLKVKSIPWQQPPKLLRISDAVKPGEIITIYGEGILGDMLEIAIEENKGYHGNSNAPTNKARKLSLVQTDPEGHFAVTVLPEDMKAGCYNIWIKNDYGWSYPIQLNAARPQWISEDTAFAGLKLKVIGRNLDGREFGAQEKTSVKLTNGLEEYPLKVISVNPFAVEFEISKDVPQGTYDVLVSNDGQTWRTLEYADEYHQKLTITKPDVDPLGLDVAWVNEFNWDNSVNVKDFGAVPDDEVDDTAEIQAAIDHVKANGGGIVYIPDGNYRITGISLPAGVVILGQSPENTVLTYAYTGADAESRNMIGSKDDGAIFGRQGVARLKLVIDEKNPNQPFPDHFIWLGNGWGPQIEDENLRTAEYIFMKEIAMDYPMEKRPGRGMGITVVARGHVLLKDSDLKGYMATMISSYINEYVQIVNNRFDSSAGNLSVVGIYLTFEDNYMKRHPDMAQQKASQGIFTRGPSYIAGNTVENIGTPEVNDGEAYCTENYRGGTKMFGRVLNATETTVTVAPKQINNNNWDIDKHTWAGWHIVITDGRGLGQDRLLISRDDNTYTINKPWDVIPDGTSKFVILIPVKGATYYNNTAKNGAKGYWFYNDTIDSVMIGNKGENIEGFYTNTYQVERPDKNDSRFTIGYFIRMEANEQTGISTKSNVGGIGVKLSLEDGTTDAYAYNVYGISIKDNSITGILPTPEPTGITEAPDINGIYVVNLNKVQPATRNAMKGIVIENNSLSYIDRGISLGGTGYPLYPKWQNISNPVSWGVIIKDNTFDNVQNKIIDPDTEGTVYYDYIKEQLNRVVLNIDKVDLKVGQMSNLNIEGILTNGQKIELEDAQIIYNSSNLSVAAVENGKVKAKTKGSTDIWVTVTLNGITIESNKVTVTVMSNDRD